MNSIESLAADHRRARTVMARLFGGRSSLARGGSSRSDNAPRGASCQWGSVHRDVACEGHRQSAAEGDDEQRSRKLRYHYRQVWRSYVSVQFPDDVADGMFPLRDPAVFDCRSDSGPRDIHRNALLPRCVPHLLPRFQPDRQRARRHRRSLRHSGRLAAYEAAGVVRRIIGQRVGHPPTSDSFPKRLRQGGMSMRLSGCS